MIRDALISMAESFGALTALGIVAMAYPRTRHVAYACMRFAKLHLPKWALVIVAICAIIPGEADELLVLPVLFAITLRTHRQRMILARYVRTAWAK